MMSDEFDDEHLVEQNTKKGSNTLIDGALISDEDDDKEKGDYNLMEEVDNDFEPRETQNSQREGEDEQEVSFLRFFFTSAGPPQIIFLCALWALSFGSTIGAVPAILTQKYAVLHHGFDGICTDYDGDNKPQACLDGSSDAQTAAAAASFTSNAATFFTSSLIGSLSDEHGRRSEYTICFSNLFMYF